MRPRGCHLHKGADISGNLLGVWFLGSEDMLLAVAGGSGEGGRADSPCRGGGIPGYERALAWSVLGSWLYVVEAGAAVGGSGGWCWLSVWVVQDCEKLSSVL